MSAGFMADLEFGVRADKELSLALCSVRSPPASTGFDVGFVVDFGFHQLLL